MNYKKIVSIIIFVVGVVLLSYGFYGKMRMDDAREDIDSSTGFIPDNPIKGAIVDGLHGRVDEYTVPVALCFIGGIVFMILGGAIFYACRHQKWTE